MKNNKQKPFVLVIATMFAVLFSLAGEAHGSGKISSVLQLLLLGDDDTSPNPPTVRLLNDTGVTWGGNATTGNNTTCTSDMSDPQDCNYGRDATHNDNTDGHAGFSFTKISSTGAELPASATAWSCVKDNVSGAVWEVKTNDGGLHDRDDTYSWYDTDSTTNGGLDGYADTGGNTCFGYQTGVPSSYCNTQAYVNRVNQAGLCGHSDWQVPDEPALRSIVDYSASNPAIDIAYFPNTRAKEHWVSNSTAKYSSAAIVVDFLHGVSTSYNKSSSFISLRLVRGNDPLFMPSPGEETYDGDMLLTTPNSRFTINADGTVNDKQTGLMWVRCPVGLSGSTCTTGTMGTFTWQGALAEAESATVAGHNDWRAPNANELNSIVEWATFNPAINRNVFPSPASTLTNYDFWTSTPVQANPNSAFVTDFDSGGLESLLRTDSRGVRLVRDVQ